MKNNINETLSKYTAPSSAALRRPDGQVPPLQPGRASHLKHEENHERDHCRTLAQADVQEGVITAEQYEQYIGKPYVDGENV